MSLPEIKYAIKKATVIDIFSNLEACDKDFFPPLSERVSLMEYSNKLYENSVTFEAWNDKKLIGMVAAYFNNVVDSVGYISNVCVENKFKGNHVASNLMMKCLHYAAENHFKNIVLEVNANNNTAISLYEKFNFRTIDIGNGNIKMQLENITF
ncbi:MAG: GNAT family N-acetyltransferase [Clostridiales bacterium]